MDLKGSKRCIMRRFTIFILLHKMKQTRYTVDMGVRGNAYRNSAESLKATDVMEELGVHIRTVLKWILKTERIGFIIWCSRG